MNKIEFDFYDWDEFEKFLRTLPVKDEQKLVVTISKIEEYGLLIAARQEWIKKLDKNLYEIRSKRASNIQRAIYFHVNGDKYTITHGFTKKSQKTPTNEIKTAKSRRETYMNQYRGDSNEQD